jgi:hypothetical protein
LPGDDDGSRGQRGPQRNEAREGPVHGEEQAAGDHGGEPGPAQHHAQRLSRFQVGQRQGQQRSQRELPQPGPRIEVGIGLVAGRLVDREHQGSDEDAAEGNHQDGPVADFPAAPQQPPHQGGAGEDEGPKNEDLALDGQRPEVLERAGPGVVLRVVVHCAVGQQPVLPVEEGRPRLVEDVGPAALRQDQPGSGQHTENHDDGGRDQPLEEVQPVAHEAQRRALLHLADEGHGQQECGDEEEDVHAAGNPAKPHVVRDHHEHRQGAKALDLGPVARLGLQAGSPRFMVLSPCRLLARHASHRVSRSRFWHR